jgi:hypothetical protein
MGSLTNYIRSGQTYAHREYCGYDQGNDIQVRIDSVINPWILPPQLSLDTWYDCLYAVYFPDSNTPESFHVVDDDGGVSIIMPTRHNFTLSFS